MIIFDWFKLNEKDLKIRLSIATPTFPRRPVQIAYTDFGFPPPISSIALRPVPAPSLFQKNAIAADAQIIAMMPSATIAP